MNPTRPEATGGEVLRRLKNLGGAKRGKLEDWGYPVAQLAAWAAGGDAQADEVDALLAIILNRGGYQHDADDVAAAEKIGKKLGAKMTPHAYLVAQHKAEPLPVYNLRPGVVPGHGSMSNKALLAVFGGVFLAIVIGGVVVAALG
ncbi:hypothetical protein [Catenulispora pinisilvae]|uniref:hypothetical protein n=1 Tax=Catenulispora pinisilvae TaxID=2705253 RepID=UPI0018916312|nr:hypothetical protein [Catenulispora pinisilvae]